MRLYTKKIIITLSIALIVMSIVLIPITTYGEDKITMQKLSGTWWTYDAGDVPWAIQINEDGTFRMAHTVLRLQKMPIDEGRFKLEGTSLILISNKDCKGSCKGLKGKYKIEFTKYNKMMLTEQDDQCMERKEVCRRPWRRAYK